MLHTGVEQEAIGRYVLIPGSVERAQLISEYFDEPRKLCHNREFLTYVGMLEGARVAVTSTGIGGPSMAITVEELHACGADTFIRVGSCASTSPKSKIGDVIIPCGAARMEGIGEHFLPVEFPAVPHYGIFRQMEAAAKALYTEKSPGIPSRTRPITPVPTSSKSTPSARPRMFRAV